MKSCFKGNLKYRKIFVTHAGGTHNSVIEKCKLSFMFPPLKIYTKVQSKFA